MAVLNQDTRLVMTILFVGALSGANVWVYANYGTGFPYTTLAHGTLFGLGTIGAIMVMKALFDRKIAAYWERKARDEQQRNKMRESAKQYNTSFINPYANMPTETDDNTVGSEFLAATLQ